MPVSLLIFHLFWDTVASGGFLPTSHRTSWRYGHISDGPLGTLVTSRTPKIRFQVGEYWAPFISQTKHKKPLIHSHTVWRLHELFGVPWFPSFHADNLFCMPVAFFAWWPGSYLCDYYKNSAPLCLFFWDIKLLQIVCFSEIEGACYICSLKKSNKVNQLISKKINTDCKKVQATSPS